VSPRLRSDPSADVVCGLISSPKVVDVERPRLGILSLPWALLVELPGIEPER